MNLRKTDYFVNAQINLLWVFGWILMVHETSKLVVLIASEPVFIVYPYFLLPCIVCFMVFKDEVMSCKLPMLTSAFFGKLLPSDKHKKT